MKKLGVAVIGCGLVGKRRARWAGEHPRCELKMVVDSQGGAAFTLAQEQSCFWETDWREAVARRDVDAVVVSTPNHLLAEIACAALARGKHVLVEKPMGRNLKEALAMRAAAKKARRKLKVGFNHRYHPAVQKARRILAKGTIGRPFNARAQYGHGGRKGYEQEWRGDRRLAGGGELTDQGVHLIDLLLHFLGKPEEAVAFLQTAVWPIRPSEDNGFATLRSRLWIAQFHSSWTQWKNLFRFELFGTRGSLTIEGLGSSYGAEKLTLAQRNPEGGAPDLTRDIFLGEDLSWKLEWDDFVRGILLGQPFQGTAEEGLAVMRVLDALYRSQGMGKIVPIKYN